MTVRRGPDHSLHLTGVNLELCRWPAKSTVDPTRNRSGTLREQVGIDPFRRVDARVPECRGDRAELLALIEEERREGVAEVGRRGPLGRSAGGKTLCAGSRSGLSRGFCGLGVLFLAWPLTLVGVGLISAALVSGGKGPPPILLGASAAVVTIVGASFAQAEPGTHPSRYVEMLAVLLVVSGSALLVGYCVGRLVATFAHARIVRELEERIKGRVSGGQ